MADESPEKSKKDNVPELKGWQKMRHNMIQRATNLVDVHGTNVKFVVQNDPFIFQEIVEPTLVIDEGLALAYQLENRDLEADAVKVLKDEYFEVVKQVKALEEKIVSAVSVTNQRNIKNGVLKRKVRDHLKKPNEESKE